jgi:hypothetical protein
MNHLKAHDYAAALNLARKSFRTPVPLHPTDPGRTLGGLLMAAMRGRRADVVPFKKAEPPPKPRPAPPPLKPAAAMPLDEQLRKRDAQLADLDRRLADLQRQIALIEGRSPSAHRA